MDKGGDATGLDARMPKSLTSMLKKRWSEQGGFRDVLRLALPLILSTGSWSIQQFMDRMFLTWYSADAIAAASPAGIFNFTVMSLFIGTASYVGTFVAQYYGANMPHRIGPAIWQGIYVAIIGGLFVMGLIPLAWPIFNAIGHDMAVREQEVIYFQYLCIGSMPLIAAAAMSSFFSGIGKTVIIMWVNLAMTAINIILDYGMIFGRLGMPQMGIKGAAIATSIAAFFNFFAYLVIIVRPWYNHTFHTIRGWRFEKELFWRLVRFGVPSGVQFFLDMSGFTAFLMIMGRLGTVNLAATNIAFNINTIAFMPMLGFGIAISVLVGQYLGKNRPDLAQKSTYSGFIMTFVYMATISFLYVAVPGLFIEPFAARSDPWVFSGIWNLTVVLLRFVAVYSLFDTLSIVFSSALKGAGDTRFIMYMIVGVSVFVLVIPSYIGIIVLGGGLYMGWTFASLYVIFLGLGFLLRFLKGKWKSMRVIEVHPPAICAERRECPAVEL
jgi:MATE family multidrug resistance protein